MDLRSIIFGELQTVAAEQKKQLPPLTDDLALQESGLDSLCFAILFARLEDITGGDPLAMASTSSGRRLRISPRRPSR